MSDNGAPVWFHSNRYNAQAACEHCAGFIRHEPWCITVAATVHYAYEVVADPGRLSLGDTLILHSLGVTWAAKACENACKTH
jgi:hypothetical protein